MNMTQPPPLIVGHISSDKEDIKSPPLMRDRPLAQGIERVNKHVPTQTEALNAKSKIQIYWISY